MANFFKMTVRQLVGDRMYDHLFFLRHHLRLLHEHGIKNRHAVGETEYRRLWRPLSCMVDPFCYRLYGYYCNNQATVVPTDLLANVIEPVLNPPELWGVYEDKNMFDRFLPADILPQTVASRIAGGPVVFRKGLGKCFVPLILKPSAGSSCGDGVMLFKRSGNDYFTDYGIRLNQHFLQSYGNDFVLQEAIEQHPQLSALCSTSVNTIRMAVYRSVRDGMPHITGAVLRIGAEGNFVDNVVSGGCFIGLDIDTGVATTPFINRHGIRFNIWNGIDCRTQSISVPVWRSVKDLARKIADAIPHHHLLSLDIAVDINGKPILIEYNIGGFSTYLFQFTGQPIFGRYTKDVIEYVLQSRG